MPTHVASRSVVLTISCALALQVFRVDEGNRTGITTIDIEQAEQTLDMQQTAMFTFLCKLVCG